MRRVGHKWAGSALLCCDFPTTKYDKVNIRFSKRARPPPKKNTTPIAGIPISSPHLPLGRFAQCCHASIRGQRAGSRLLQPFQCGGKRTKCTQRHSPVPAAVQPPSKELWLVFNYLGKSLPQAWKVTSKTILSRADQNLRKTNTYSRICIPLVHSFMKWGSFFTIKCFCQTPFYKR